MAEWQRTHTCGELRMEHLGQTVVLNGWVHTYRDHNVFNFIDLRDRYGLTQVVFDKESQAELYERSRVIRDEWVLSVTGEIVKRLPGKENPNLPTGQIEVKATAFEILNKSKELKFEVTEFTDEEGNPLPLAGEDLRLQFRYLDLRRRSLQQVLMLRHRMNNVIRRYLDEEQFVEVETPLLGRSTPEGARDYLVPSRVHEEAWYALPQSPQLYKQLLMVSGFDRYYQIARCLRDEDLRADRQPEFTQLDVEMSFVELDDVLTVMEGCAKAIFKQCLDIEIETPLPRLAYEDVMLRYGTDKPDLRFGLEIVDLTELAGQSEFKVFQGAVEAGGKVRGIRVPGAADNYSRKGLDKDLKAVVEQVGAKGLAWIKVEADKFTSPIEKFLPAEVQAGFREKTEVEGGDLLLMVADSERIVCQALDVLRNHLARELKLLDPDNQSFALAWIVDFPSFFWDEDEKRWFSNHHPFTAPRDEDIPHLESDPGKVRAKAYDMVINGYEVGGGSIRIHSPDVQQKVFGVLGMSEEEAQSQFGFLLNALAYGAPPHGGIALGLDRWAMILADTTNIRDVIAFPKNQRARDLMTGAPAPVSTRQLKELGLK